MGYESIKLCRRKDYQTRIKEIVRIASMTIDSSIKFKASWEIKDNQVFTQNARKFIGEIKYQNEKYLAYYISKNKGNVYIRQILNDIQKAVEYNNILIFMENYNGLSKNNNFFMFGKKSTLIINPNNSNLEKMKLIQKMDLYEMIVKKYIGKEILLSNWQKADFMTNKEYIVLMPFLDTEKVYKLNIFFKNNKSNKRKIDIVTLKENRKIIEKILSNNNFNFIELEF